MSEERKIKVNKGNNLLIILFVFIQFQVSSVCNLHGFSPQGDYNDNNPPPPPPPPPPPCNNSKLSESEIRIRRDSESFYNSFVSFRKVNEKINYLTGTGEILTREIKIKQGRLKGVVKEFKNSKLKNVETFLGIPYAAPPVKSLRFMPPGSPPTWKGVRILDTFGAVCPQKPPDLSHEPLKTMNAGHFNHLKGLMAFLSNQSEDCLYLNIYAPMQDYKYQQKFPVIVYIHGESFEWNSGNPYDGSILASYGNVVVVTINFRLGILGFLRPGLSDHTVSNFGLLDQIAALQWIKENIEEFGGDSSLVTLMGHGTGAACINFLMVSPVSMASQGLFHKAILMSGTALSDWALTHNPLQFTIQVAEALNCPLIEVNDELSNCLRRKRLSEIMSVKITVPEFQTAFGPIVDGSVVPNTPQQVMGVYQNLFTRYELLYGMTEWETYHLLDPVSLTYGMLEGERNEFLRKYMYSRYEALPYFALATTLSEYLDWRKPIPPAKSAAEEHRDLVLDLLSDAMFGAPIIQMALYHSKINPKSYLYIFQHKNKFGEFAGSERSISGEEIAYVFGIPLLNEEGPLSHHKFSISEQLLSESILTYFTNFAKTGNPNAPRRSEYLTQGPKEWQQYDVYWPEYDSQNQSYLAFEIPPHVSHHYRSQMTQFWNEILPDLLNNPTKLKPKPEIPFDGDFKNGSHHHHHHKMPPPSPPAPPPNFLNPGGMRRPSEDSSPWTYGTVRVSPEEYQRNKRPFGGRGGGGGGGDEKENHSSKQMDRPLEDDEANTEGGGGTSSSSVPYFVALSVCLLIINASVIGFYCHKRKRLSEGRSARSSGNVTARADLGEGECKKTNFSGESVYSVVECSEGSQTKGDDESKRSGRLKRCLTNTAESSSKVRKWFREEVVDKYSKNRKEPRKPETIILSKCQKSDSISECSTKTAPPLYIKPILKNPQRIYKSNEDLKSIPRKQVQKVSVGVDATPSTRGDSVLKQTPIEITKSLDRGLLAASYSAKTEEEEVTKGVRRSRTSVSLQLLPTSDDLRLGTSGGAQTIKLEPRERGSRHNFRTFAPAGSEDVNVTSRDPEVVSISDDVHADPLENIQKRNFPKVLPDFPGPRATERLSFPQSSPWNVSESNRTKQHPPPPPPPRVSTLQKREDSGEQRFQTFSSVTFKKPETDKIESNEPDTEDSSSTTEGTIKKQPRGVKKVEEQKENKSAKRREQPSIVIQPKIGPKKGVDLGRKGQTKKLPHVNLQLKEPNRHLDTKGPSDRV